MKITLTTTTTTTTNWTNDVQFGELQASSSQTTTTALLAKVAKKAEKKGLIKTVGKVDNVKGNALYVFAEYCIKSVFKYSLKKGCEVGRLYHALFGFDIHEDLVSVAMLACLEDYPVSDIVIACDTLLTMRAGDTPTEEGLECFIECRKVACRAVSRYLYQHRAKVTKMPPDKLVQVLPRHWSEVVSTESEYRMLCNEILRLAVEDGKDADTLHAIKIILGIIEDDMKGTSSQRGKKLRAKTYLQKLLTAQAELLIQ